MRLLQILGNSKLQPVWTSTKKALPTVPPKKVPTLRLRRSKSKGFGDSARFRQVPPDHCHPNEGSKLRSNLNKAVPKKKLPPRMMFSWGSRVHVNLQASPLRSHVTGPQLALVFVAPNRSLESAHNSKAQARSVTVSRKRPSSCAEAKRSDLRFAMRKMQRPPWG